MKSELIIKDILTKGESSMLEFKESINKDAIARTVCGFLNGSGGQVLIGVKDDKSIVGVKNAKEQVDFLSRFLVNVIVPAAPIMVSAEEANGCDLILIEVYSGSRQPYIYSGSIYFRKDSRTIKATSDEISKLIHDRQISETHWERQTSPNAEISDLDEAEIRATIRESIKMGRSTIENENEIEKFLISQNLYENGHLTNAALILFAKEPLKFLPQASVRLSVFQGSKISNEFLYDSVFSGSLFSNINKITSFFDVNIATLSKFNDNSWKRSDAGFPRLALREGLLNALIHRDYSSFSSSVLIGFYADRLEISNYGTLPDELKLADLKVNHLSLPRNPDIAQVCFLRGWIEKIGRGTLKILDDTKDKGLSAPSWHTRGGATTLVFPGITVTRHAGGLSEGVNEGVSEGDTDGVRAIVKEYLNEGVNEGLIEGVTKGIQLELERVLTVIIDKPGVNASEVTEKIGKSLATTERYISLLRQLGTIERKGVARTSGYYPSIRTAEKIKGTTSKK